MCHYLTTNDLVYDRMNEIVCTTVAILLLSVNMLQLKPLLFCLYARLSCWNSCSYSFKLSAYLCINICAFVNFYLSPCEQSELGGSKFNWKKNLHTPVYGDQEFICLFVTLLQNLSHVHFQMHSQKGRFVNKQWLPDHSRTNIPWFHMLHSNIKCISIFQNWSHLFVLTIQPLAPFLALNFQKYLIIIRFFDTAGSHSWAV